MADGLPDQAAFNLLFSDLVERLLALADSPARCSDFIAEQIRSLLGVRTVLVLECPQLSGLERHRLLSVFPERRRGLGEAPEIERLALLTHDLPGVTWLRLGVENSPASAILGALGIGESVAVPLRYTGNRVGVMLLLDILDSHGIESVLGTLDRLSSILALVIRNASLYAGLEREVRERTRELSASRDQLLRSLQEKEVLLKEIHHRVKNNLQIINSLFMLQMQQVADPRDLVIFEESQNRIHSMALVHEELYRSESLSTVDMPHYVRRLVDRIAANMGDRTRVVYELGAVSLPVTLSVPCGLLLNELVTNAIRHAFAGGKEGELRVRLRQDDGRCLLSVEDNGVGLPPDFDLVKVSSLGLTLVDRLARQIRAELMIERLSPGTRFSLSFSHADA